MWQCSRFTGNRLIHVVLLVGHCSSTGLGSTTFSDVTDVCVTVPGLLASGSTCLSCAKGRHVFFDLFGFMTMFTFLLFSNSSFSGVSVMMASFLFLRSVAVAFQGPAFGYGHRASCVCL